MPEWMHADVEDLYGGSLTPVEFFELFFDDDLFDIIVHETNRYASQKNRELRVTREEMKVVFGVLLISSYVSYPRRRLFWETGRDTRHDMVSSAIRRDRFESIFTNLHFADNHTLSQSDKLAKLRPLLLKLNENFMKHAPVEEVTVLTSLCVNILASTAVNNSSGASPSDSDIKYGVEQP